MITFVPRNWADLRAVAEPALTDCLLTEGMIFFRCPPDVEEFLAYISRIMAVRAHRDADERGLTAIRAVPRREHSRSSYEAFSRRALRPHTDGTSLPQPPSMVALLCIERAQSGGLVTLADGVEIYRRVETTAPAAAEALSRADAASFGAAPAYVGAVFRRLADGRVAFRYRDDSLIRFGPDLQDPMRRLRHAVRRSTGILDLDPGTGYILQNSRWVHGRTSYRGHRLVARVVGNAVSSTADAGLAGFTPPTRPVGVVL